MQAFRSLTQSENKIYFQIARRVICVDIIFLVPLLAFGEWDKLDGYSAQHLSFGPRYSGCLRLCLLVDDFLCGDCLVVPMPVSMCPRIDTRSLSFFWDGRNVMLPGGFLSWCFFAHPTEVVEHRMNTNRIINERIGTSRFPF